MLLVISNWLVFVEIAQSGNPMQMASKIKQTTRKIINTKCSHMLHANKYTTINLILANIKIVVFTSVGKQKIKPLKHS